MLAVLIFTTPTGLVVGRSCACARLTVHVINITAAKATRLIVIAHSINRSGLFGSHRLVTLDVTGRARADG